MEIGTLRERLWLLAHDDRGDLQPLLHPGALEIGLMAAVLVDLLLGSWIVVDGGRLHQQQTGRRGAAAHLDPITAGTWRAIGDDTPRLSDVLRAARADLPTDQHHPYVRLYQRTQAALVAAGVVVEHRRVLRSSRYQLADPAGLSWNKSELNHRLVYYERPASPAIDCLCALVGALNLHTMLVTPYATSDAGKILRQITRAIPANAGPASPLAVVPHLADCMRTAVGDLATAVF
ncbi:hypothetical protein Ato02nite_097490 [Paractinoplanes toevensis]|uniref:GPP34 family phosphoprotein n=1 Tax=Paractinoplanes toevensis TaxID=571911 RepID=A0A919WD43_9ACTN|nr:hypothetical protein Ato02nite_097490 [Actinoplanes toevensis]